MDDATKIITQLSEAGFRVTKARCAVIEVITQAHASLSADEILIRAKHIYPNTGLATVYRTLDMLRSIKQAKNIKIDQRLYAHACGNSHLHLHLVCTQCHSVTEMVSRAVAQPLLKQLNKLKFKSEDSTVEVFGVCQTCQ